MTSLVNLVLNNAIEFNFDIIRSNSNTNSIVYNIHILCVFLSRVITVYNLYIIKFCAPVSSYVTLRKKKRIIARRN